MYCVRLFLNNINGILVLSCLQRWDLLTYFLSIVSGLLVGRGNYRVLLRGQGTLWQGPSFCTRPCFFLSERGESHLVKGHLSRIMSDVSPAVMGGC